MKKICILAYTDLSRSPRQLKQIKHLSKSFEVVSVGETPSGYEHSFIKFTKRATLKRWLDLIWLLFRKYEKFYWTKERKELVNALKLNKFDLFIVHNQICLPIVDKVRGNAKIILDAHEFYTEDISENYLRCIYRGFEKYIINGFSRVPDVNIAVTQSIADEYFKKFGVEFNVIRNVSNYIDLTPTSIDVNKIKLVHHGIAAPIRKIENLIKMMDYLDENYHLTLVLVRHNFYSYYYKKLVKMANSKSNIVVIPPYKFDRITTELNSFDIGVSLIPPITKSEEFALPNKFFEYIQARLAIAFGPLIESKKIIESENIGVTSKTFKPEDLANSIKQLSVDDIMHFKDMSHKISGKYSFETEAKILDKIINNVM